MKPISKSVWLLPFTLMLRSFESAALTKSAPSCLRKPNSSVTMTDTAMETETMAPDAGKPTCASTNDRAPTYMNRASTTNMSALRAKATKKRPYRNAAATKPTLAPARETAGTPTHTNNAANANPAACRQANMPPPPARFPPRAARPCTLFRRASPCSALSGATPPDGQAGPDDGGNVSSASATAARTHPVRPNCIVSVSSCPHRKRTATTAAEPTARRQHETTSCVRHRTCTSMSAALPRESPNPKHPSSKTISKSPSLSPRDVADGDGSSFCPDFVCAFSIHEPPHA